MDLVLHRYERDGVAVLAVGGELDLATAPRLREGLVRLVTERSGQAVVVHLAGVAFIDSVGIGVLVGALGRARSMAGDLLLAAPPAPFVDLLAITGLDAAFAVHATLEAALAAASPT